MESLSGLIDIDTVKFEFERWEKQHQDHLRKLVGLLKKLKDFVRIAKGQRCVVEVYS